MTRTTDALGQTGGRSLGLTGGRIALVGVGPGDPGLLTRRAAELVGAADLIVHDAAPPEILALADPDARVELAETAPNEVAKSLVAAARAGESVVRLVHEDLFAGDDLLAEVKALARSTVPYEIVPAIPFETATTAYAGVLLRPDRAVADVRHGADWAALAGLAVARTPLVLLVPPDEVGKVATGLLEHGLAGGTPVSLTADGTTDRQRTLDATLETLEAAAAGLARPVAGQPSTAAPADQPGRPLVVVVGLPAGERRRLPWWESRALYGWRVLVPRTKEQAGALSALLRGHGAIPAEVPTIAVEPPRTPAQMERAIKGLVTGRYEWVIFTSTNAVRAVWEKFREFGLDARAFAGVKIACVGDATATAVRGFGIQPELVPAGQQSAEGLLAEFPPYDAVLDPINRVLLPRADIATEPLAAGLLERGWEVDDVTAYRTVRAAPPPAEIRDSIKQGGFDAVLFTSSSTVRNLVGIAGKPHPRTVVACIGPQTAETARELGLRVDVQPAVANVPALVEALAAHVRQLKDTGQVAPPPRRSRPRTRGS